jgi:DNA polymerase-3 subunit epsilon
MREIVLDTETTGLSPVKGDRIIEIAALELLNHLPTGKHWHVHLNPQRDVPLEATAVHGITTDFLKDKPLFDKIAQEFLDFIADAPLIIHNASFDLMFLNAELSLSRRAPLPSERAIDTLLLARQKHPMGPNSLDALCKRYGVDNSARTKHGALIDCELLAEVYIELIGGRQPGLILANASTKPNSEIRLVPTTGKSQPRPSPLPSRLSDKERADHHSAVSLLGDKSIWKLDS